MINSLSRLLVLTLCASLALGFVARADEAAEKGRTIFSQNRKAVVTVQVVVKVSSGRSSNTGESKTDVTGTVVDPSGLTVVALSSCDPSDLYRLMNEGAKIDVEVTDVKILLEDGTELPAEIVLRDHDLDLAFLRPKTKPAAPMAAVDLTKSSPAQVLDQSVTLNRLNRAAGRAYSASVERISAVISKPRTFYIPDSMMSTTTSGSPAFMLDGNVLGIFVLRAVSAAGGSGNGRDGVTAIILPASDVLKAARQAPEAKGEDEKKDAAKPAVESKDDK